MSAAGPHPTTRLVLAGHRQFMKRDGSGCWAGVRRLAIVTGLDKSTVAKHRALAIGAGWLIVSPGRHGRGFERTSPPFQMLYPSHRPTERATLRASADCPNRPDSHRSRECPVSASQLSGQD